MESHIDMTPKEISNDIAKHFEAISQEYEPLQLEQLDIEIQTLMTEINECDIPILTEFEVY